MKNHNISAAEVSFSEQFGLFFFFIKVEDKRAHFLQMAPKPLVIQHVSPIM